MLFSEYQADQRKLREHTLKIDSFDSTDDDNSEEVSVQFIFEHNTREPTGFCWASEYGLGIGTFNKIGGDIVAKKKSFTLQKYLKKGKEYVEDAVGMPRMVTVTDFHIIFTYHENITVLSKITLEIVFAHNFEITNIKGSFFDPNSKKLLVYAKAQPLFIADLKGEDRDAWRHYLKKGMVKESQHICKTAKQKAFVAGLYADQLFTKEKFDIAADYYARSNKTFEEITLRFLKSGLYSYLEIYL